MLVTESSIDPSRTLPALRAIETAFSASVLHPAVLSALRARGVAVEDVAEVNIVTRSAGMRSDNPAVVWSAFFNPNPVAIYRLIPSTFRKVPFDTVLAAQSDALDDPFKTATASMAAGELAELAELCRAVTIAASQHCEGRPLFAGLASLPLPAENHMMVWHAARLLREHRGDGHIAALVVEGLGRIDALVVHAALMPSFGDGLRRSRRWNMDEWNASIVSLRRRGWLTDEETPTFTAEGRARRKWIEDRTDELAAVAFDPIGHEGLERFIALGANYTRALEAGGMGSTLRTSIPMGD
jgi:helix-turn-helix protein